MKFNTLCNNLKIVLFLVFIGVSVMTYGQNKQSGTQTETPYINLQEKSSIALEGSRE